MYLLKSTRSYERDLGASEQDGGMTMLKSTRSYERDLNLGMLKTNA